MHFRSYVPHVSRSGCLLFCLVLASSAGITGCRGLLANGQQLQDNCAAPRSSADRPHIILMVLENQKFEAVVGNSVMPFVNGLISQGGLATQFYADTHPSLGNYFMLTAGDIISNDNNFTGPVLEDNIAHEMCVAGASWKSYSEDLPQAGYLGDNAFPYAKTHNPFAYFANVISTPSERNSLVPYTQFTADLQADSLPEFSFIDPNQYHNTHFCIPNTACTGTDNNAKLAQADDWLSQNVPLILANPTFQQNGILIITFDESWDTDFRNGGGRIPVVIVGPKVKAGFQSTTQFAHESVLRLIADTLGVTAPNHGATAPQMSEFFNP